MPSISSLLNNAGLDPLGQRKDGVARSPLDVLTGIHPVRAILQIIPTGHTTLQEKTIFHAHVVQVIAIEELQQRLNATQKEVSVSTLSRRDRSIGARKKATNIFITSFIVDNFVLDRRATDYGHNTNFRWCSPRRI